MVEIKGGARGSDWGRIPALALALGVVFVPAGCSGESPEEGAPQPAPAVELAAAHTTTVLEAEVMGTHVRLDIGHAVGRGAQAEDVGAAVLDELRRLEGLFNMWSPESGLQRWNAAISGGAETAEMARELALCVDLAARVHAATDGAFDPTVATALADLGFFGGEARVAWPGEGAPFDAATRARWRSAIGMDGVHVDWVRSAFHRPAPGHPYATYHAPERKSPFGAFGPAGELSALNVWPLVQAADLALAGREKQMRVVGPGRQLDLSAVAKGYAADLALVRLTSAGFDDVRVDLGGSSVRAVGTASGAESEGWPLELPDPGAPQGVRVVRLRGAALSTSGRTSLTIGNAPGAPSHQFDPRTLAPVAHKTEMVAVVTHEAWLGDMLATALLVMGAEEGAAWCRAHADLVLGYAFWSATDAGPEVVFAGTLAR